MVKMSLTNMDITEAVWEQIVHEKYNENLYLYLGACLRNKGLDNLAKKFDHQAEEESSHAKMFIKFLTDLSAEVKIGNVPSVDVSVLTMTDVAKAYLEREMATTVSIDSIKKLAIETNDPVAEEFFRKMIHLQQAEYSEATEFFDKVVLLGDSWSIALLWDVAEGK
jgi:ferritin